MTTFTTVKPIKLQNMFEFLAHTNQIIQERCKLLPGQDLWTRPLENLSTQLEQCF